MYACLVVTGIVNIEIDKDISITDLVGDANGNRI